MSIILWIFALLGLVKYIRNVIILLADGWEIFDEKDPRGHTAKTAFVIRQPSAIKAIIVILTALVGGFIAFFIKDEQ